MHPSFMQRASCDSFSYLIVCKKMKKVSMLHTSPELAAHFLYENVSNVDGWWNSVQVQKLVKCNVKWLSIYL
jgi:hypothetical protein